MYSNDLNLSIGDILCRRELTRGAPNLLHEEFYGKTFTNASLGFDSQQRTRARSLITYCEICSHTTFKKERNKRNCKSCF